jgi:nucleoside-diphosphate-sugar epimerase
MKTYLVTGSQGFLGRYLVANLLLADPDVRLVGLGRSPRNDDEFTHHIMLGKRSVPAPLPAELLAVRGNPRYSYIAGDLRDLSELVATLCRVRPQVVFHLASALRDEPVDALFQINVEGSVRLIEAIAAARL